MSTRPTFRISIHGLKPHHSNSQPQVPNRAGSESLSDTSSKGRDGKKRSRGGRKGVQQRTRKRKNCTDPNERRRQLEADEWTLEVRSTIVRCLGCKRWIKLDQRNEYYSGLWDKHRDLCRGIKMMKGEPLPKRTRRSKKKPAASPVTDSASGTPPAAGSEASATPEAEPARAEILPAHTDSESAVASAPVSRLPSPETAARVHSETLPQTAPAPRIHRQPANHSEYHKSLSGNVANPYPLPSARPTGNPYPPRHVDAHRWPQHVPYNYRAPYHHAYYPVSHPVRLPPLSEMMRARSPSPGPSDSDIEDDSMGDDDDTEPFAFAPAVPDECHEHNCRPRFRYSTRHEIQTYFDGATLDSMAQRATCSADDMMHRECGVVRSLSSLKMK
ncbi:hypothetical protein C0995_005588 [Termitomyces sp. Mi166|nr:hypothetical protein C0995_005588 [Termitomyces sp. Mi166\